MATEKTKEFTLKLKKNHPRKAMKLGKHVITPAFKKYALNSAEEKELKTEGCKTWFISKEEFDKAKKSKK